MEYDRVCLLAREFARLSVPSAFTPWSIVCNWVILHANNVAPPPFPHHSYSQSFVPCTALHCIGGPSTSPPYWHPFKENTDAWRRMKRIGIWPSLGSRSACIIHNSIQVTYSLHFPYLRAECSSFQHDSFHLASTNFCCLIRLGLLL